MKNRTLLLIIFLTIFVSVNAQRFKGGILIGINASQIEGDTWSGFYKGGLLAGAFVNTELQDKFGAQLEIKYSEKGSGPHKDHLDYPKKIRLNYIDVPILGTYQATSSLKIETGVSFNYLFKSGYYSAAWFDFEDEDLNNFETAILVGLNYSFFARFDLNIRWNYSLFPVRGENISSSWGQGSWFNQVINFGLYFHLGQKDE